MNRNRRPFKLLPALGLAALASGCLYDPPVYDSAAGYGAVPYGNGYVYDYGYGYGYDSGYCGYGYGYNYSYCSAYADGWPYWGWGGWGWDGWWGGYWGGGYWHHSPTFQSGTTGPGPWNGGHPPGMVAGPGRFSGFHPPMAGGFAHSGGFRSGGMVGGRRGGGSGFHGGGGGFHGGGFHGH